MLYSQDDFNAVKGQATRMGILYALCILAILLGGLIPMLAGRQTVLSIALSTAAALLTLFLHGTFIGPVFKYRRFMKAAQENIRRTYTGQFLGQGDISWRDGVRFIGLRFLAPDQEEAFQCYVDYNIPLPDLKEGKTYTITHTGNSMLAVEEA